MAKYIGRLAHNQSVSDLIGLKNYDAKKWNDRVDLVVQFKNAREAVKLATAILNKVQECDSDDREDENINILLHGALDIRTVYT